MNDERSSRVDGGPWDLPRRPKFPLMAKNITIRGIYLREPVIIGRVELPDPTVFEIDDMAKVLEAVFKTDKKIPPILQGFILRPIDNSRDL